jgi:hypothetical protein
VGISYQKHSEFVGLYESVMLVVFFVSEVRSPVERTYDIRKSKVTRWKNEGQSIEEILG